MLSVMRRTSRLLLLFCSCGLAGWVLCSYKTSVAVWVFIEVIVLYLSWAGVGAIAGAVVGVLGLLWGTTLLHREAVFVWAGTALTSAQDWAIELLLNWLLAAVLTFQLAFAHPFLCAKGWNKRKAFCLLAIVTNLGFGLGQYSRTLLP